MKSKKFYGNSYLYLGLGIIIVVLGFYRSYFSKMGEMAFSFHLHGISASLWMILLIVQPYLYKKGNLGLHRKLGWISVVLVPLIIIGGIIMMRQMIAGQANYPPDTVYQLAFIDAVTLISFGLLYFLALRYRRNVKLHARFMVCTIFGPLLPALTRIFLFYGFASSFTPALAISYLLVELTLILIIWLERSKPEIKYTYIPLLLFTIIQHILMYYANDWSWWQSIMNTMSGYNA